LWEEYTLGTEVETGTYEIKLEGEKKPSRTVDWQITSQGKLIDEWAVWEKVGLWDGIKAYWTFDETTGDVIDELGSYNGTNNGATRGGTGIIEKSFSFDGGDWISFSDDNFFKPTASFSMSIWFKTNTTTGNVMFSSADQLGEPTFQKQGIIIGTNSNGTVYFYAGEVTTGTVVSITSGSTYNDNAWHNAVVTVTAAKNATLYVDNVSQGSATINPGYSANNKIYIGCRDDLGSPYRASHYTGSLDELGLWNRSLTSGEVSRLYNSGSGLNYGSFDLGEVTLNSPADTSILTTSSVDFNCSATQLEQH